MLKRNRFLTIVELNHEQQSKHLRIKGLQPRYEAKAIYHIEGMCADLEEELLRFPKAVHDDVSDATAYQSKVAEPPVGFQQGVAVVDSRDDRIASQKDIGVL